MVRLRAIVPVMSSQFGQQEDAIIDGKVIPFRKDPGSEKLNMTLTNTSFDEERLFVIVLA